MEKPERTARSDKLCAGPVRTERPITVYLTEAFEETELIERILEGSPEPSIAVELLYKGPM
jgi:hypothetical protein